MPGPLIRLPWRRSHGGNVRKTESVWQTAGARRLFPRPGHHDEQAAANWDADDNEFLMQAVMSAAGLQVFCPLTAESSAPYFMLFMQ